MRHRTVASRLRPLALGGLTLAVGLSALAGTAAANTFTATDTKSFAAAVKSANMTNGDNTILVSAAQYSPAATSEFTNATGTLTIQGPAPTPSKSTAVAKFTGAAIQPVGNPLFMVDAGVTVDFSDIQTVTAGTAGTGAFDVSGTAGIAQSTITGNGPGLFVEPGGTLTMTNATVFGGLDIGIVDQGTATLTNTTVTQNSQGGIDNANGTLSLVNSIVAKNGAQTDCTANANASDKSLDGDGTCGVGTLSSKNPMLGPLNLHGGSTPTAIPAATSPVIAAGDSAKCPAIDQRGAPRAAGAACDLGSVQTDTVKPVFTTPNMSVAGPASGATVNYTPTWTDAGAPVASSCSPDSGTVFPIGQTTVTCTGTDSFGNTAMGTFTVTVDEAPTAVYTAGTNNPAVGQTVSFDGSQSSDPDATIVNYRWIWGDGTPDGSGPTPTHTFTTAGTLSVGLYVTDSDGHVAAVGHPIIVGDELPQAVFTDGPYAPAVGQTVSFNGSASSDVDGTISSYRWVWGDGTPDGTGATPTHTFSTAGQYSVALFVTDSTGLTGVVAHAVTVGDELPTAAFSASTYKPAVGQTVSFNAGASSDPDGSIVSYRWVWGDGFPDGSGPTPTHVFGTPGTVSVKLYVTDSDGVVSAGVGHGLTVAPAAG